MSSGQQTFTFPPKVERKPFPIPAGVRQIVYSFLKPKILISSISRLSSAERKVICTSKNVDQKKVLTLRFREDNQIDHDMLIYCLNLCTEIQFEVSSFQQQDLFLFKLVLSSYKEKVATNINFNLTDGVSADRGLLVKLLSSQYKSFFKLKNIVVNEPSTGIGLQTYMSCFPNIAVAQYTYSTYGRRNYI